MNYSDFTTDNNVVLDSGQPKDDIDDDNGANPDPDTIKMFVGQIPKSWDENKLKEFFEHYGPVYHLNVLRDKETENSRGCCFITFYHRKDAIDAQNALHNIHTMPGLNHPVQMKPADMENRNDRKLFIGMLSKSMVEDDVREIFKEFGQIEDCSILRENGKSKGCAFLTFVSRSCAHQAIRKMNQSKIFEGCTKAVVVKFADSGTVKDKTMRKPFEEDHSTEVVKRGSQVGAVQKTPGLFASQQQSPIVGQSGVDVLTNLVSLLQQPGLATLLESARVLQQIQTSRQQQQSMVLPPSASIAQASHPLQVGSFQFAPPQAQQPSISVSSPRSPAVQYPPPSQKPALLNIPTSAGSLLFQPSLIAAFNPYQLATSNPYPYAPFGFAAQPSLMAQISPTSALRPPACGPKKNFRGPEGCNLFIYHLPQEFTDADLYATFCSFGNILSAKVFVDKQTNLSKCFGFVSFSDEASAHNAINGMNGHQVGNKRLKVQLKRSEKPYDKP